MESPYWRPPESSNASPPLLNHSPTIISTFSEVMLNINSRSWIHVDLIGSYSCFPSALLWHFPYDWRQANWHIVQHFLSLSLVSKGHNSPSWSWVIWQPIPNVNFLFVIGDACIPSNQWVSTEPSFIIFSHHVPDYYPCTVALKLGTHWRSDEQPSDFSMKIPALSLNQETLHIWPLTFYTSNILWS